MLSKIKDFILDDEFRLVLLEDRVLIVNFKKILYLEDKRVSILTSYGKIVLCGTGFLLSKLLDKEVLIGGNIERIDIYYE